MAAAGGSEAVIPVISQWLYGTKDPEKLTAEQKDTLSAIAGLIGTGVGATTGNVADVAASSQSAQTAVDSNYLTQAQDKQKEKELIQCTNLGCISVHGKWILISSEQKTALSAGFLYGVPNGLVESVKELLEMGLSPIETYNTIKSLFKSDDVLATVSDTVKQAYLVRIDHLISEYNKAGIEGAFNAGVEAGKLFTDVASLFAGGAGLVKGGVVLTQKIATKTTKVVKKAVPASAAKGTTGKPIPGVGGNGAASKLPNLNGVNQIEAQKLLKQQGFNSRSGGASSGGWETFKHADGSQVDINWDTGRTVRTAAPKYGADGSRINKGQRLDYQGKEIPRNIPHDQHPKETIKTR